MCVKNNYYHTNPDVMKGSDIKELISSFTNNYRNIWQKEGETFNQKIFRLHKSAFIV